MLGVLERAKKLLREARAASKSLRNGATVVDTPLPSDAPLQNTQTETSWTGAVRIKPKSRFHQVSQRVRNATGFGRSFRTNRTSAPIHLPPASARDIDIDRLEQFFLPGAHLGASALPALRPISPLRPLPQHPPLSPLKIGSLSASSAIASGPHFEHLVHGHGFSSDGEGFLSNQASERVSNWISDLLSPTPSVHHAPSFSSFDDVHPSALVDSDFLEVVPRQLRGHQNALQIVTDMSDWINDDDGDDHFVPQRPASRPESSVQFTAPMVHGSPVPKKALPSPALSILPASPLVNTSTQAADTAHSSDSTAKSKRHKSQRALVRTHSQINPGASDDGYEHQHLDEIIASQEYDPAADCSINETWKTFVPEDSLWETNSTGTCVWNGTGPLALFDPLLDDAFDDAQSDAASFHSARTTSHVDSAPSSRSTRSTSQSGQDSLLFSVEDDDDDDDMDDFCSSKSSHDDSDDGDDDPTITVKRYQEAQANATPLPAAVSEAQYVEVFSHAHTIQRPVPLRPDTEAPGAPKSTGFTMSPALQYRTVSPFAVQSTSIKVRICCSGNAHGRVGTFIRLPYDSVHFLKNHGYDLLDNDELECFDLVRDEDEPDYTHNVSDDHDEDAALDATFPAPATLKIARKRARTTGSTAQASSHGAAESKDVSMEFASVDEFDQALWDSTTPEAFEAFALYAAENERCESLAHVVQNLECQSQRLAGYNPIRRRNHVEISACRRSESAREAQGAGRHKEQGGDYEKTTTKELARFGASVMFGDD